MALRETDAWDFLNLKKQMVEADHLAVLSDGRKVPVFIYTNGGQQQYCIEGEGCFYETQKHSGFVRFEKIAEPIAEPPVPDQKMDSWTPPPPIARPGSKSTAQDERWNPRFHKMNLERVQKGCLFAEKCLGVDYASKEKYYRCRCVTCGKTVQASQSDLLYERIKYCAKHE